MPVAESVQRRAHLKAAMENRKADALIGRAEMMTIWGVSAGRLTQVVNLIPNFPAGKDMKGKLFYPRKQALKALWDWEHKGDKEQEDKQRRLAAITGVDETALRNSGLSMGDLIKASQMTQQNQERMKAQGLLTSKQDQQAIAGKVFELISRRLSNLGTVIDPNGMMTAEERETLDEAGKSLLLSIYAEMRDILSGDEPDPTDRSRSIGGGARSARPVRMPR